MAEYSGTFREEVLNASNRGALEALSGTPFLSWGDLTLAGGTAIALRLGHRVSDDLDFIYSAIPVPIADAEGLIEGVLGATVVSLDAASFMTHYRSDSKLSLIYLPNPSLEASDCRNRFGVRLASLLDLALMKILAVTQRGTERDFIDLYFLGKAAGLHPSATVRRLGEKYRGRDITYEVGLAMKYFEDAEREQERPTEMLVPCNWSDVKAYCVAESDRILRG